MTAAASNELPPAPYVGPTLHEIFEQARTSMPPALRIGDGWPVYDPSSVGELLIRLEALITTELRARRASALEQIASLALDAPDRDRIMEAVQAGVFAGTIRVFLGEGGRR